MFKMNFRELRAILLCIVTYHVWLSAAYLGPSDQPEAYFNGTSYIRLKYVISLKQQIGLSFRTCTGGELFSQKHTDDNLIELSVDAKGLRFLVKTAGKQYEESIPGNFINNKWHTVLFTYTLGNLTISVDDTSKIIANASYRKELLFSPGLYDEGAVLIVGRQYSGCVLEGPSIVFNQTNIHAIDVKFGRCPIPYDSCIPNLEKSQTDFCITEPCMRHGICESGPTTYTCNCYSRYTGKNCEIDNGNPCKRNPCKNGATCVDDIMGNYICSCLNGYTGKHCEHELKINPLCSPNPCMNGGTCNVQVDSSKIECICPPGFMGPKCETNVNECNSGPCKNGGRCTDDINNYTCDCSQTGYRGQNCEENINECLLKPCLNYGTCFDTYGGYICQCPAGFDGSNCQLNINECVSQPCLNNGACEDKMGDFECHCPPGITGKYCEKRGVLCDISTCPPYADCKEIGGIATCVCKLEYPGIFPNCTTSLACITNPCKNGGTCTASMGSFNCTCPPGFTGIACEHNQCTQGECHNGSSCLEDKHSYHCICPEGFTGTICEDRLKCTDDPCEHATSCQDFPGGYYCNCELGWMGLNCEINIDDCVSKPCLNGATCIDMMHNFKCHCAPGYTGERCHNDIDECASMPCLNGGICIDKPNGFLCNCTDQWMGTLCERPYDACDLKPCLNNATCTTGINRRDFTCSCLIGFDGTRCEINIDDCEGVVCPPKKVCRDLVAAYECRCPSGYTGEDCNIEIDPCIKNPCTNGGTCSINTATHDLICTCPPGFTGRSCNQVINECSLASNSGICNNGICVNVPGGFQCYCKPGYTGEWCDLDFDECLSMPCKNNAKCLNKVNNYECVCTPGYTGKDCSININECDPMPCFVGSTCVDGINEYNCICQPGMTGRNCDENIDDCVSSPCLNGAECIDGLNSYTCNCTDTGYSGEHCEININDCIGNPCINGAECIDEVKDYRCNCHPGYTGKNCEKDINECESNPCQHNGTCLERSNVTLYNPSIVASLNLTVPESFKKVFEYEDAAGYECLCVAGTMGPNCAININECESSPCRNGGICNDKIGGYECDCAEGFEGNNCDINIDECEIYKPCIHGICYDGKANYDCVCDPQYGGKNCSVELIGCTENPCLNDGTCKPYLINETEHKFNCTCQNGFQGATCEKETTMSLSGQSQILVNTTREEGYDIQFKFKTTLGDGLLALGKGNTYYILELSKGRLNLHSSLLNKWEGVFVGSNMNNSVWQKVFVAINSSHLVLSANEEQTIYPISFNDNSNGVSFPTTYIGGIPSNLKKLTHGQPFLVGCAQDVVINGEWVLPESKDESWLDLKDVETGCRREPQCNPNPCHSGGHCTDKWKDFSCTCERPYLGRTCQYNFTAATFGYENIKDSLVTVSVQDLARRAIRSIVDISMFIRTRQSQGQIFYLGSSLGSTNLNDETYIAAQLENGELLVRIQFNGTPEAYTVGGVKLNNGYNHLIEVIRNVTLVQVKLNGTEYFRKTISSRGMLNAQVLFLGGQPQLRPVRQAMDTNIISKADVTAATGPAAAPLSMIHFKGIIQDVQISNGSKTMVVEFFPLKVDDLNIPMSFGAVTFDNTTVLEGVLSDDSCKVNPCEHNGTCINTWNDYRCECQRGYKGKDCTEQEFCQLKPCPKDSECKNLEDGYECLANATFSGEIPPLQYNLTSSSSFPLQISSLELTYRTKSWGTALFVKYLENYFVIFIYHNEVIVEWNIYGNVVTRMFKKDQYDGQWTSVYFKIKDSTIKGGFKELVNDDTPNFVVTQFDSVNFTEIFTKGVVYVGGSDNKTFRYWDIIDSIDGNSSYSMLDTTTESLLTSNSIEMESPQDYYPTFSIKADANKANDRYKGCLGEIRIDKLLLPFYTINEITTELPKDFFDLQPGASHEIGCTLCYNKDCFNNGYCIDPKLTYKCQCPKGFDADDCSVDINECLNNECKNNATCIDQIGSYECQCMPGYEGELCDQEIDECISNPCHNGGTCTDLVGAFKCHCPEDFVGKQCEAVRLITCENQPCKEGATCQNGKNIETGNNFTCICAEGMVGILCDTPFCLRKHCENGHCNTTGDVPVCQCQRGFEGEYCEHNIDDCITATGGNPCQNGGQCIDGINRYDCNCTGTGYSGLVCEFDRDECAETKNACGRGTCQNIPGNYRCICEEKNKCGHFCSVDDPCQSNPCVHGTCEPTCGTGPDYMCHCKEHFTGKNCDENELAASQDGGGVNILYIVVPIVGLVLIGLVIGLLVLVNIARSKRATRGTYSPSAQEFCNPRVELDHVLKPPPEERLI